jgi:hypothetical protein
VLQAQVRLNAAPLELAPEMQMIRNCARIPLAIAALSLSGLSASQVDAREFCTGTELPITSTTGRNAPYVDLSFEGKGGPFLLDYGASASSIEDGVWVIPSIDPRISTDASGQLIKATGLSLPGWATVPITLRIFDRNVYLSDKRQQYGVIGVDLIERQNVELHYEQADKRYVVVSAYNAGCDTTQLKSKGFVKISQAGHWAQGGVAPDGIHNGPVAYFALADEKGGVTKTYWAQIDTGYEDSLLVHSIEINKLLLDALQASGTPLVEGQRVQVTGCDKAVHMRRTFTAPGRTLRVRNEADEEVVQLKAFHLLLKEPAEGCGGISTATAPAGQMGASFLKAFGTTIFMGSTKEVWIRPAKP